MSRSLPPQPCFWPPRPVLEPDFRACFGRSSVGPRPSESAPDKARRRRRYSRRVSARRRNAVWRTCSRPKPGGLLKQALRLAARLAGLFAFLAALFLSCRPGPAEEKKPGAAELWKDPTLKGKLHLTYRAAYQAQFFRFGRFRFNFPDIDPADRQFAAELEDRRRRNQDHDLDQYFAVRTHDLIVPATQSGWCQGLDTEFSIRGFTDLDGTAAGNESLGAYDRFPGGDQAQLGALNFKALLLQRHLEFTGGRQYFEGAEYVHFDGGRIHVRGLGLFDRPVEIDAFAGARATYFPSVSRTGLYGGALKYFPAQGTEFEFADVYYLDNSLKASLLQRLGPLASMQLLYRQVNEHPESAQLEAVFQESGWGLEARGSYYGRLGRSSNDFTFDYTFSERAPVEDRDHDRHFNLGEIDPYDEASLEVRQEITGSFGLLLGGTGHWVRGRSDRDAYNSDWREVWGGLDSLHFPWEGLTGRAVIRYLDTDLPRRQYYDRDDPRFISDVTGDGEPRFVGLEARLEQDWARKVAVGTAVELRNYEYSNRFADLAGLNAWALQAHVRWRPMSILSFLIAYDYEKDYRFLNPDFKELHALKAQVLISW
ncbi:MAG: hypothetical protein HY717_09555 [Planctomycetes bacterium]|nr:hypothetical protein [Planctomycetota bacterium]